MEICGHFAHPGVPVPLDERECLESGGGRQAEPLNRLGLEYQSAHDSIGPISRKPYEQLEGAFGMTDRHTVETTDEARQGETSNHMRWVLLFTLLLTIFGVGIVWLTMS